MAQTGAQRWKKWYQKPGNKEKFASYIKKRRLYYRHAYDTGLISYKDIPISYRTFREKKEICRLVQEQ